MPSDGARILATYKAIDNVMAKLPGGYATSPQWMAALEEFWLSGKRRVVFRKGRQSGGSTTMARVAAATAIGGEHAIPAGSRGEIGFTSVKLRDANERLYNVEQVLAALDVKFRRSDDTIEFLGRPILFRSGPCTGKERGMMRLAWFEDEMSSWRNDDGSKNPATEVEAAAIPSLITQKNGRIYSVSSPMGSEDLHAELVARGTNESQCVFDGPSWYWNPTISEDECRKLAADERTFRREFAAIPQGSSLSAFDPEAVEAAFAVEPLHLIAQPALVIDAAARGGDGFAFASVAWARPEIDDEKRYEVDEVKSAEMPQGMLVFKRDFNGHPIPRADWEAPTQKLAFGNFTVIDASFRSREGIITADDIAKQIADLGHRIGAHRAFSDNFEAFGFESLLARHHIKLEAFSWAGAAKPKAIARLRRMLSEKAISFDRNETLRRQLLAFEEVVTANGIRFAGKDPTGGHFDLVSAVLTGIMAEQQGALTGSLVRKTHGFGQFGPGDFGNS